MTRLTGDLQRIEDALAEAASILGRYRAGAISVDRKQGGDPVTEADRVLNEALLRALPRDRDGWLSEETRDDFARLESERVWIVDPLDGTREFVAGIPEYCVSIGLAEGGACVAGGILNPAAGHLVLGALGRGVTLNGRPVTISPRSDLAGAVVLASRSEVGREEWRRFENAPFEVRPMGSVAYKLALVAAGLADATWTLVPKHEWDVAAGVALVRAAGGDVFTPDGSPLVFNSRRPRLPGLVATCPGLKGPIRELLEVPSTHV